MTRRCQLSCHIDKMDGAGDVVGILFSMYRHVYSTQEEINLGVGEEAVARRSDSKAMSADFHD